MDELPLPSPFPIQADPTIHRRRLGVQAPVHFQRPPGAGLDRGALAAMHLKLVERYAPPSLIVNADHDVIHLSEHAGAFLQFGAGQPTTNLLRLARPELRAELRAALLDAAKSNAPVHTAPISLEVAGAALEVAVRVVAAEDIAPGCMLVVFDTLSSGLAHEDSARADVAGDADSSRVLEGELQRIKSDLHSTIEHYEAAAEDMQANVEALQSANKEMARQLREFQQKLDELTAANEDLQNLMSSTSIATVLLGPELAILRYTPTAAAIFHLIPGDIGRPLADLKHHLDCPTLMQDAESVFRTREAVDREIGDGERWYFARFHPYRIRTGDVGGVVLTFVDVTDRHNATAALRLSEERLRLVMESAKDYAIFTMDCDRKIDSWNPGAAAMFGYSEADIVGQPLDVLFTPEDRADAMPERTMQRARAEGCAESERWHARRDGSVFFGSGSVMPLRDHEGQLRGYVKILRDLTETKRTQEALNQHVEELTRFNAAAVGRETRMIELKREVNDLCVRLNEAPRYDLGFDRDESES